jgi:hypothetical protein
MTLFWQFTFQTDLGEKRDPGQQPPKRFRPGKGNGHLFNDQIILYGLNAFDALGDFNGFIDGLLRINETAQLNAI